MEPPSSKRLYSAEEKRQLIANLDIEGSYVCRSLQRFLTTLGDIVAHRNRQFEARLADNLENFKRHQEGQVSRIPKQVRNMTMREFGEKYEGNIQSALRGFQRERLAAAGGDATLGEIDKSMRKRKWVASQEAESELSGSSQSKEQDMQRAIKSCPLVFRGDLVYQLTTKPSSNANTVTSENGRIFHRPWHCPTFAYTFWDNENT